MIASLLKYKTAIGAGIIVVMAIIIWLLFGQVGYAKESARLANEKVVTLETRIETLAADQKRTGEIVAARMEADRILNEKLAFLQKDLNEVIKNDSESKEWAATRLPPAIVERLRRDENGNGNKP